MNIKKLHKNFLSIVGAPMVQVEITEDQVAATLNEAKLTFDLYASFSTRDIKVLKRIKNKWIEKYVYGSLKETLAHIRGKFESITIPDNNVRLRQNDLINCGIDEKQRLLNLLY